MRALVLAAVLTGLPPAASSSGASTATEIYADISAASFVLTVLAIYANAQTVLIGVSALSLTAVAATAILTGRWPAAWFNSVCAFVVILSFGSTLLAQVMIPRGLSDAPLHAEAVRTPALDAVLALTAAEAGAAPWGAAFFASPTDSDYFLELASDYASEQLVVSSPHQQLIDRHATNVAAYRRLQAFLASPLDDPSADPVAALRVETVARRAVANPTANVLIVTPHDGDSVTVRLLHPLTGAVRASATASGLALATISPTPD